jgi:hypothetical protein
VLEGPPLGGLLNAGLFGLAHPFFAAFVPGGNKRWLNRGFGELVILKTAVGLVGLAPGVGLLGHLLFLAAATWLLTARHFAINNAVAPVADYQEKARRGYAAAEELSRALPDGRREAFTALLADAGPVQSYLSRGFSTAPAIALRDHAAARLAAQAGEKFFAQFDILLNADESARVKMKEVMNLVRLGRRFGLAEDTVVGVAAHAVDALGLDVRPDALRAAARHARPAAETIDRYAVTPVYGAQDVPGASGKQVSAIYLNALPAAGAPVTEEARVTAEHALAMARRMKPGDLNLFVVKIARGPAARRAASRDAWLERLETVLRPDAAARAALRRVPVVVVESDAPLTHDALLGQSLRTLLGLQTDAAVNAVLGAYSLGLYTATLDGLDARDLEASIVWLLEGLKAVPLLQLLDGEGKKDQVLAAQA